MKAEAIECPACDGPMTKRVNRRTGEEFYGCNDYPRCRGTINHLTDGQRATEAATLPSEKASSNDRGRWRREG